MSDELPRTPLAMLSALRKANIEHDIDLPHFVVAGIQSAGKTTIIERLTGLRLPRGDGACTRCPMEFRSENCPNMTRLSVDISHRSTDSSTLLYHDLSDFDDICDKIGQAQHQILPPNSQANHVQFTEDCLYIQVKGPAVKDYYFFDLPGVVQGGQDGQNEKDAKLPKRLVTQYVSKPNCIVLLVVSCDTEFVNQWVTRLVGKDRSGDLRNRTIGIMTKADRLATQHRHRETWLDLFDEEKSTLRLGHGWFALRLEDQSQLPKDEKHFFATTEPWSDLRGTPAEGRLGLANLERYVSDLLAGMVEERLQPIQRRITTLLNDCEVSLSKLPVVTVDSAHNEILSAVTGFIDKARDYLDGKDLPFPATELALPAKARSTAIEIKIRISNQTPVLVPLTAHNSTRTKSTQFSKKIVANGDPIYMDDVAHHMACSWSSYQPPKEPPQVALPIARQYIQGWHPIVDEEFLNLKIFAITELTALAKRQLGAYQRTGLFDAVRACLRQCVDSCWEIALRYLQRTCQRDPLTLREDSFKELEAELVSAYKSLGRRDRDRRAIKSSNMTDIVSTVLTGLFPATKVIPKPWIDSVINFVAQESDDDEEDQDDGVASPASSTETLVAQETVDPPGTLPENGAVAPLSPPILKKAAHQSMDRARESLPENMAGAPTRSHLSHYDNETVFKVMAWTQIYLQFFTDSYTDTIWQIIYSDFIKGLGPEIQKRLVKLPEISTPEACVKHLKNVNFSERASMENKRNELEKLSQMIQQWQSGKVADAPVEDHDSSGGGGLDDDDEFEPAIHRDQASWNLNFGRFIPAV